MKFNTRKGIIATAHNANLHAPATSGCSDWRLNITGADIGIHLLFPFILGLKFFPLHKILSHYICGSACCSFVLPENLLWINYPTVEDPPPKRTLPSFP